MPGTDTQAGPGLEALSPYDRLSVHQLVRDGLGADAIRARVPAATPPAIAAAAREQLARVEEEIGHVDRYGPDHAQELYRVRALHERRHRLGRYLPDRARPDAAAAAEFYRHQVRARLQVARPHDVARLVPELEQRLQRLEVVATNHQAPTPVRKRARAQHARCRAGLDAAPQLAAQICAATAELLPAIAAALTRDHPAAGDFRLAKIELDQVRQLAEFAPEDSHLSNRIELLAARQEHARESAAGDVGRTLARLTERLGAGSLGAVAEVLAAVEARPRDFPPDAGTGLRRAIAATLIAHDPYPWTGLTRDFEPSPTPATGDDPSWS
jgi:hypothetical protein